MYKELNDERKNGDRITRELVEHTISMRASGCERPVTIDGVKWKVIVKQIDSCVSHTKGTIQYKDVMNWFLKLKAYAEGNIKWDTNGIWVCESHPLMPFEQGLSFDCQCGGPGMSPIVPKELIECKELECPICGSPIVDGRCEDVGGNNCGYTND